MDRLREALAVELQRVEAAVAIVGLLVDRVDDPDDLTAVIHDVVWRWRELEPADQDQYGDPALCLSGLTVFAWEYVDQVALAAFGQVPEEQRRVMSTSAATSMEIGHWRVHIDRVRARDGEPELSR